MNGDNTSEIIAHIYSSSDSDGAATKVTKGENRRKGQKICRNLSLYIYIYTYMYLSTAYIVTPFQKKK